MMNNYLRFTVPLLLALLLIGNSACVPPEPEEIPTTIDIAVTDSLFQRISDWQDLRQSEDLFPMLRHQQPSYRYLAARAFASIQDPDAIDSLGVLLNDPIVAVRAMAAFAIGQTKDPAGLPLLIRGFVAEDTAMVYGNAQRAILEAVGKCGEKEELQLLSSVSTYTPQDTALLEGQAWGIYRFGLRKIHHFDGTSRMVTLADPDIYPASVRLIAANYLARVDVQLDTFTSTIITAFEQAEDPNIRMALAIALGKTARDEALTSLMSQYRVERDYRVKCNILRAFSNFPYENCRTLVIESLRDPNEHVARRAAQYLLENAPPQDADQLWRFAKDSLPTPIHLVLYQAANRHLPAYRVEFRDAINAELRQKYRTATTAYEKTAAIRALGEFAWNYRYIYREGQNTNDPIIKTATTEALLQITERPDFTSFFGLSSRRVSRELGTFFLEIIRQGSPGATAIAAQALRTKQRDFNVNDSLAVLTTSLEQLELPAMTETYNALAETIASFNNDSEFEPIPPKFNQPIDWDILEQVGDRPQLQLEMNKGSVILQLWPGIAPGSVANLLNLAKDGFLKDKAFHRVVPNFVIQGGSPSGDAYGSLDYSIRSELSDQHYDQEGLLGMASAGLDTEGTQFFITHSPTLHLDGNYTVFGQVIEGMDVIHNIQLGDRIKDAKIIPTQNQ